MGEESISVYDRAAVYRHIQVLVIMFNDIQKGPLASTLITAPPLVVALSITLIVRNFNADFIFNACLVALIINCLMVVLIMLGELAMINRKSFKILEIITWKQITKKTTREAKWEHKYYKSCAPLKIMICWSVYVDSFTPLNCFQSCMDLTANLLLLT